MGMTLPQVLEKQTADAEIKKKSPGMQYPGLFL